MQIKRLKDTTITCRLIASFALIIVIFMVEVIYSGIASHQIDQLHSHNINFVTERSLAVVDFHQEFTEMRRLLRETFMHANWRESADQSEWQRVEQQLTASRQRLYQLAEQYMESVWADHLFTGEMEAIRIYLMSETIAHVDQIYYIFHDNFFLSSNQSYDHGNVLEYTAVADEMLQELRRLSVDARQAIMASTRDVLERARVISIIAFIGAVLLAAYLGFLMVRSFKNSVRSIQENVALVTVGDFETSLKKLGRDEISRAFAHMINVFVRLIEEINHTTNEVKNKNSQTRMDLNLFEGGYRQAALAINDLLDTVAAQKEENERMMFMFNQMPLISIFFDSKGQIIECNDEAARKFKIEDKNQYKQDFNRFSPELQPNGRRSGEYAAEILARGLQEDCIVFDWVQKDSEGRLFPVEVVGVSGLFKGEKVFVSYARDVTAEKEAQEREQEVNQRLRLMFDATPVLIAFWDEDSSCVDSNPYVLNLYGLASKKEYGRRVFDLMPERQPSGEPSQAFWKQKLEEIRESGYATFKFVCQKQNGELIYTEVAGVRMKMNGRMILATYSDDVTEVVLSQQAAKDAAERTQLMLNASPILIEFWNQQNEIIDCNPFVLKLFRLASKEEYIERYAEFLPRVQPDGTPSWSYWVRQLEKVFEEGHNTFDMMLVDRQGEAIYTEVVGVRMTMNSEVVAVTYSNDVTKVKKSIEKIKKAEERTNLMLNGTPVACYLISRDFTILDCNREAVALFDFASKEEALKKSGDIFAQSGFGEIKRHFDAAFNEGFAEFEWALFKADGTKVPCEISFVRFELEDAHLAAAYVQDLTVFHQMLAQKEKMQIAEENSQAKTKFLASISHEIRTPITAVMGISEIQLQNPALPLEAEEAFAKIYDSATILLNIINDILDISKIETGKMDLILERYEVSGLAIDTVQMHLIYLGSKDIRFAVNADEQMPAYLKGDELRIKQILNNILSNAFKYTDAGKVTLDLRCEYPQGDQSAGATAQLIIRVTDTGKGMTESQLAALQDEYTRFHEKETRFTQGTGLGMPIVTNLVALMGGKFDVKSQVGVGTTVTICLPQEIAGEEKLGREMVKALRRFESGVLTTTKKMNFTPEPMPYGRVLIVDDVETNLYVAKGLMGFYNLQIETVTSGYAAIEKVKGGEVYDIIFMDYMMPGLNGIEAAKTIRRLGYTAPIVALTANALIGQAEEFLKSGFDGFVSKPIQTARLNAVLNKFVREKQPPEVLEAARGEVKNAASKTSEAERNSMDAYYSSPDIKKKLRKEFLRTQGNIVPEIVGAIAGQDIKTAHRLAHTLKGLAGLIFEDQLLGLASRVEGDLKVGKIPTRLLDELKRETERVIGEITEQFKDEPQTAAAPEPNKEKAKEMFDKLAALLAQNLGEAMDLIDDLAGIPGTKELIAQIEDFEFAAALETLEGLRESLGV